MIRRALCLSFCFTLACVFAAAQCPKLKISGPDQVDEGQPITFSVALTGGDRNAEPTFNWTVSAGTISSGQGTSTITVDTTDAGGQSTTATVDVGGYDRNCVTYASSTAFIEKRMTARKIDQYGVIRLNDEQARLDNFAIELQNDPMAQGYVIAYGGRKSSSRTADIMVRAAKTYLVNTRGIEASRIVTVNGGFQETPATELWIVPSKAAPPVAKPTVDPSELRPPATKPAPKKSTTKKKV